MNLPSLLLFVPLGVGVAWLFYLIFKANLATQSLGKIVSYFVGVLIIVLAVGWLIDNFLPSWVNDRLQNTTTSTEWREVIDTSTGIIESSFDPNSGNPAVVVVQPTTPANIIDQQPPVNNGGQQSGGSADQPSADGSSPTRHTIVQGDTLTSIASQYGTSVEAIVAVNGLTSHVIYAGDVLVIPAGK
ncbi:MAG: LysM peptidoglycan-binding domain-containing protein [Chloroflexi bacterium]|nr:LysM peptidoglycan-binding domain-containing protein [Chloroflexota bacterium]